MVLLADEELIALVFELLHLRDFLILNFQVVYGMVAAGITMHISPFTFLPRFVTRLGCFRRLVSAPQAQACLQVRLVVGGRTSGPSQQGPPGVHNLGAQRQAPCMA